jgi:hypothetical protein
VAVEEKQQSDQPGQRERSRGMQGADPTSDPPDRGVLPSVTERIRAW